MEDVMKKIKIVIAMMMLLSFWAYTGVQENKLENIEAGYLDQTHLDNRVIFQNFSLFQPYEKNMYNKLTQSVNALKEWGITDVWTAPGSRSFDIARYSEGYALTDRYDLGEFNQGLNGEKATKYGTSDELKNLINRLHQSDIKIQMDLVPNQMFGMSDRQYTKVTRVNSDGNVWAPNGSQTQWRDRPYLAYTKGSFQGQKKYGVIKEWNQNHFIGTSLQNQGDRLFKDGRQNNGSPYYYLNSKNYKLPSDLETKTILSAFSKGQVNLVDGYLPIDGWLAGTDGVWRPILAYAKHYKFDQYLSSKGYTRARYYAEQSAKQAVMLNDFLQVEKYNMSSEEESLNNNHTGIDSDDQFMFTGKKTTNTLGYGRVGATEFLLGLDVDYLNTEVQRDTANWVDFLLNTYNFDGFRVDAVSHYDASVLDMINTKVKARGNGAIAYLESYGNQHKLYLDSKNNDMMSMNYDLFNTLNTQLGYTKGSANLANIFVNNNRYGTGTVHKTPNWSFVNNHDQEKNQVNKIILAKTGVKEGVKPSLYDIYTKALEQDALNVYFNDVNQVEKKWSSHNVISQYAYLLSMKNTTPTVYYGDLYRGDKSYMSTPSVYYNDITKMLIARKQFAKGDEQQYRYRTAQSTEGQDLVANVRIGTNKNEGMAVVISDNAAVNETIQVNVGKIHAGQKYRDILNRNTSQPTVDKDGNITIQVKGTKDVQVSGYVGVWVPVIEAQVNNRSSHFAGFVEDKNLKSMNVKVNALVNSVPVKANDATVTLKSNNTNWTYTIPAEQVTDVIGANQINVNLNQSLFTIGETYSLLVNGVQVANTLSDTRIYYFENGNRYSGKSMNGVLGLQIISPLEHKQELSSILTKNNAVNDFQLEILATAGEYNLDISRVVVTLESDIDKVIVPESGIRKSANNNKIINVTFSPKMMQTGQSYKMYINGRVVTASIPKTTYRTSGYIGSRLERYRYVVGGKEHLTFEMLAKC